MLVEIKCDIFRENTITFHTGLNVVLGDEKKVTLLVNLIYY